MFFASDWQKSGDGWQPPGIDQKVVYVALSDDDGKTWQVKTLEVALPYEKKAMPSWLLEEHLPWHDHDTIGYSVASQSPNGLIHLITTSNHPAQHFEMNEAWILSDSQRVSDAVPTVRDVTAFEEHDPSGRLKARWEAGIGSDGRYLLHGKETHYGQDGRIQYEVMLHVGGSRGEQLEADSICLAKRRLLGWPGGCSRGKPAYCCGLRVEAKWKLHPLLGIDI